MLSRTVVATILVSNILYIQCLPQVGSLDDLSPHQLHNQTDVDQQQIVENLENTTTSTQTVQNVSQNVRAAKRSALPSKNKNVVDTAIKVAKVVFKGVDTFGNQENSRPTRQNQIQSNTQVQYNEGSQQSASKSTNVVVNQNDLQTSQVRGVPQVQARQLPAIPQSLASDAGLKALPNQDVNVQQTQQNEVQTNTQLQYNEASQQTASKSSNIAVNQNDLLRSQIQGAPQVLQKQYHAIPQTVGNSAVGIGLQHAPAPDQFSESYLRSDTLPNEHNLRHNQVQSNAQLQYNEASQQTASKSSNIAVNQNDLQRSYVQGAPQVQQSQYHAIPQTLGNAAVGIGRLDPYYNVYPGANTLYNQDNLPQNQGQTNTQLQYNEASQQASSKSTNVVVNQNHLHSGGSGITASNVASPPQYTGAYTGINDASLSTSSKVAEALSNQNSYKYTGHQSQNVNSQQSSVSSTNLNGISSNVNYGPSHTFRQPAHPQNGDYHFGFVIDDDIRGGYNERQEQSKDGKVSGYYTYDDGYVWRKVVYEADENGFRVLSDDVLPSKKVGQPLSGVAYVKSHAADGSFEYAVTRDQTPDGRL